MGKSLDGFSPEASALLRAYPWPGNVRELENVVERAVALEQSYRIEPDTLPQSLRTGRPQTQLAPSRPPGAAKETIVTEPGFNLERHLQDIERSHLERALSQANGVQTRAAEILGLSFRQFRYLAKKYGIK